MNKWSVEGSENGVSWKEIVSFSGRDLAEAAFDLEMTLAKHKWVRLVSPQGRVEQREQAKA